MADGPCGEPFKGAFSCFHYSDTEPKGVDCLENFKSMQECFLKYPDIYGSLEDDDEKQQEGGEKSEESGEITKQDDTEVKSENVENNVDKLEVENLIITDEDIKEEKSSGNNNIKEAKEWR